MDKEKIKKFLKNKVKHLSVSQQYIEFTYYNTHVIIYNIQYDPYSNNGVVFHQNSLVYFDPNYENLIKGINKIKSSHPIRILVNSLKSPKNYHKLPHYKMKKEHFKQYKTFHPDNEVFIFSDELRYRYNIKEKQVPKKGFNIQVFDTSAYICKDRIILLSAPEQIINNHYYPNYKIFKRKKCGEEEPTLVSYDPKTHKRTYYKYELKKSVNLSKEKSYKVKNINKKKFTLIKEDGQLYLIDKNKKYKVCHPDCLIYVY